MKDIIQQYYNFQNLIITNILKFMIIFGKHEDLYKKMIQNNTTVNIPL
jgi:hypothetical protein